MGTDGKVARYREAFAVATTRVGRQRKLDAVWDGDFSRVANQMAANCLNRKGITNGFFQWSHSVHLYLSAATSWRLDFAIAKLQTQVQPATKAIWFPTFYLQGWKVHQLQHKLTFLLKYFQNFRCQ